MDYKIIVSLYNENICCHDIATRTKIHRNTIKMIINQYQQNKLIMFFKSEEMLSLDDYDQIEVKQNNKTRRFLQYQNFLLQN